MRHTLLEIILPALCVCALAFPARSAAINKPEKVDVAYRGESGTLYEKKDAQAPAMQEAEGHGIRVSAETVFNTKDIFLGASLGMLLSREFGIYGGAFFWGRPFKKTVFVEDGPSTLYQLKEYRYVFGLALDKSIQLSEIFGVFLSGGGAMSFSQPAGTDMSGETILTPVLAAGLYLGTANIQLRGGYQYIKSPWTPSNRAIIQIALMF